MNATVHATRTRNSEKELSGYRPDIDGLRSIAVIGVVLFHAGLTALPGGYVGVDVFFVISGYLITRQVVSGVQRGRFSFAEFYLRRARRLLPAALVTILGTLVTALVLLPPFRIVEIAQSAASAAVSVSNFFFWQESGYWAESSASQPLLHTWSLSVEEQFYLVWPLALLLVLKFLPRLVVPLLIAGTVLSVIVTAYFSARSPEAAFYLTPFRAYEFAIGALCVWAERIPWSARHAGRIGRSATWLTGLAMILFAMLTFDEDGTTFPGWLALIPTVGTAFMILARRPTVLDAALSNPFMNYVGLRSYSIYLVHWPILVFTTELTGGLTVTRAVLCVAATVVGAELLYRLVERPLRIRGAHGTSGVTLRARAKRFGKLAVPALASAAVLCGVSVTAAWSNDRPEAYPDDVRTVVAMDHESFIDERRTEIKALCAESRRGPLCGRFVSGGENILVLGDSVAPEGYLLATATKPDANVLFSGRGGCPPLMELAGISHSYAQCGDLNARRFASVEKFADQIDTVVLAMRLDEDRMPHVLDLIAWLGDAGIDVEVYGVGAVYDQHAWQIIAGHGRVEGVEAAMYDHLTVSFALNASYARAVRAAGATYIDRWAWMCGESECRTYLEDDLTNLVMVDAVHMTRSAVLAFAAQL